jgi:hypothetical protein
MIRAYLIILVPALLVAFGYVAVFRMTGTALPWVQLIVPAGLLALALLLIARNKRRKLPQES